MQGLALSCPEGEVIVEVIDTRMLAVVERCPIGKGVIFISANMTFVHYEFVRGSSIHEHFHPQEEVYEVTESELELTIDGETKIARQGPVVIMPSNGRHFGPNPYR